MDNTQRLGSQEGDIVHVCKMLGGPLGAGGMVSRIAHSHCFLSCNYSGAKFVENSCEVTPDKVTSLSWAQFCPL